MRINGLYVCRVVPNLHFRISANRLELNMTFFLTENPIALRSHVYRAALQEIIRDKNPKMEHGSIKLTLKKAHDLPFPQYVW